MDTRDESPRLDWAGIRLVWYIKGIDASQNFIIQNNIFQSTLPITFYITESHIDSFYHQDEVHHCRRCPLRCLRHGTPH